MYYSLKEYNDIWLEEKIMYYAIMKDMEFSNGHKINGIKVYGYKTREEADQNLQFHNEKENAICYVEKVVMDKQDYIKYLISKGYISLENDLILYNDNNGCILVWKVIFETKESEESGYEESLYLKLLSKSETEDFINNR